MKGKEERKEDLPPSARILTILQQSRPYLNSIPRTFHTPNNTSDEYYSKDNKGYQEHGGWRAFAADTQWVFNDIPDLEAGRILSITIIMLLKVRIGIVDGLRKAISISRP